MSIHKDCGADVQWLKRQDDSGRYMPPMEYAGEVYIKDEDGRAAQMHAYRIHMCDPEAIVAWSDYQERLSEAKGEEYTPYHAARERENERIWELALSVTCQRCTMPPGSKCISLAQFKVKAGIKEETRSPHPSRIEDAISAKDIFGD